MSEMINTIRPNKNILVFNAFSQSLPDPVTDIFIMASLPVYLAATAAARKAAKIAIYIIRDQPFYFDAFLYPLQSPVADNAPFSQLRIVEVQHFLHLPQLFKNVICPYENSIVCTSAL